MRRLRDATHNESLLCMYNLTQFATTGRVPVADLLPTDVEAGLDSIMMGHTYSSFPHNAVVRPLAEDPSPA